MSRKDYIAVAAGIKQQRADYIAAIQSAKNPSESQSAYAALCAVGSTAARLCGVFYSDNPRFDSKRFLEACGIGS